MAFCKNCGTKLEDNAKFCPTCGEAVAAAETDAGANNTANTQNENTQNANTQNSGFSGKAKSFMNTADTTASFDQQDIEANKVMALLAYLGILFLIPLFAAKESKFARFHTNQGIILCIVGVIYSVALSIFAALTALTKLFLIITIPLYLLGIVFFIFAVLGIVNAAQGKAKELPIIGKYKILK